MPDLLLTIATDFKLDGEQVVRVSTGETVKESNPDGNEYFRVSVRDVKDGQWRLVKYHRLKFALKHGWLPRSVDHEDRDKKNNLLANLRPASSSLQAHNRRYHRDLPRCVYKSRSGAFQAIVGRKYLGSFETPEAASRMAESFLMAKYGEDYSPI